MATDLPTRERILEASRVLWNERGFGAVSVAEIAAHAGISTGNLSYHFRTKRDLVLALWDRAEKAHLGIAAAWEPGRVLAQLPTWIRALCALMWEHRFLYRDAKALLEVAPELARRSRETVIAVGGEQLRTCLDTMRRAGYLRANAGGDRSLVIQGWMLLRYWIDFLVEARGLRHIERAHVDELVEHFAALLAPHLTARARRALEAALEGTAGQPGTPARGVR